MTSTAVTIVLLLAALVTVLLAIYLGVRLGGIGIGYAGGFGVLVLAFLTIKPGKIPFDVISIIMAVIGAIAAMQVAGGLDYLVNLTEKLLRRNPKYITIVAPIVTYFLTILAGTGNISLSTLPVIVEVAKEHGIRPCRPLSTAVVSAQVAITASPISAAVVYMASVMEPIGVSYLKLLCVTVPSTLLSVILMSILVTFLFDGKLENDQVYKRRLEDGLIGVPSIRSREIPKHARSSVLLFLLGVMCVVIFAILTSHDVGLIKKPITNTTNAILIIMLTVATLITMVCKIDTNNILNASTFKAGMSACVCIMGVAWLGDTFVQANITWITKQASSVIRSQPWLLALIFFLCSALLYSQAATAKALMPMALELGVTNVTLVASFAAVSGLFILPTYPTLVAAVQMDDTGSTRIGRFVFNHSFIVPGIVSVFFAVLLGYGVGFVIV